MSCINCDCDWCGVYMHVDNVRGFLDDLQGLPEFTLLAGAKPDKCIMLLGCLFEELQQVRAAVDHLEENTFESFAGYEHIKNKGGVE